MKTAIFRSRLLSLIVSATLLTSVPAVRAQTESDEFEIIARTGGGSGLTVIGRGPSINDLGYVAFSARRRRSDGVEVENVYSVHPSTKQVRPLMNGIFEYPVGTSESPTQVFDERVQVNNQNQVLAWRNLNARVQLISWILFPIPGDMLTAHLTYLETWPVTGNENNPGHRGLPDTQIQMGDGGGGNILTLGPYPGVTSLYFINPATARVYPSPFYYIGIHGVYRNASLNNLGQASYAALQFDGANLFKTGGTPGGNAGVTGDTVARPVMADDGYSVIRLGAATGGRLLRLPFSVFPTETFANTAAGFVALGHPTISDDGKIIVFYGDLTSTNLAASFGTKVGPGMFAYFTDTRSTIRVASLVDTNDPASSQITAFYSEERPSVNNLGALVFLGNNESGQKAIFSTVVNLKAPTRTALPPSQVVAIGDTIDGLPGALTDLAIHDSLNSAGKYGDILFWTASGGVQAVVKVPATACSSCRSGQCQPGDLQCHNSSLGVKMGLGRTTTSGRSGYLKIYAKNPSETLASPAGLTVSGNGAFARLYATSPLTGSNVLRQVKGPNILADIIADSPYRYTVRFYNEAGPRNPITGLYPPVGSPDSTIVVENPDGGTSTNRLRLTRNGSEVNVFTYTPGSGEWELLSGFANGLRKECLVHATNGLVRTETRTFKDASDQILSQTVNTYQTFPWGDELVRNVEDPAGLAKTTSYSYYTNQVTDGANYARLRSVIQPEGHWTFYKEYVGDSVTKQVSQFLNNPYSETTDWPDPENRSSETIYSGSLETRVEYLKGHPISKRWRNQISATETWSSVATSPAATNWNDPANLITRSYTYSVTDTNGASVGQVARVINPDGTMSQSFYYSEFINDPFYTGSTPAPKLETSRTVTLSGQPNPGQTTIIDGTRSEQVVDALGNSLWRREYDIASGVLIASQTTTARDHLGRATRTDYLDGTYVTRTYDCCGLAQETDREGIVTTYSTGGTVQLDLARTGKPQTYAGSSVTRAGLTTYNLTDAMGRSTHTVLQGTNGALIVQEQRGYDREGNLAWSLDAMNRRTTYTNTTDGPFRISITTFPDGSQRIESTYQDGSGYETKGTAVNGLRYATDIRQDNGVWVQTSTQTRLEADGSVSPEYTTSYTDFAGRAYKTEYPWPDGPGPVFASRTYNAQGQLASSTDPDGITTLYAYNPRGELETTALDLGNPGVIDFGGSDRITRTTSSVGNSTLRGTGVRKSVTEVWETNGVSQSTIVQINETSVDGTQNWATHYGLTTHTITAIERVNQRRTVTIENPDHTSTITVTAQGRQKSVTRLDRNGARVTGTTFTYDPFGRLQAQIDARNGATTYTYYDDGQLHTVTTPDPDPSASGPGLDPQTTRYVYYRDTANGIKTVTTLPDGGVVTQEYFPYFPNRKLKKSWGANTIPTEYTYDRGSRLATITTWKHFDSSTGTGISGSATTYCNYNARGQLNRKHYADNKGPNYTYTAGGKLRTRLWARGVLTTYDYDPKAGELLTITYSDSTPAVTNTYNRLGQLVSVFDATGMRSLHYQRDQIVTEAYDSGVFSGFTLLRDYDDWARQTVLGIINPIGELYRVTYGYDDASRINNVTSDSTVIHYSFHKDSELVHTVTKSHSNAVRLTTTNLYDKRGRLQSIANYPPSDRPIGFTYSYNDRDQRTRAVMADGEFWLYGYDTLGQVTNGAKHFPTGDFIPGYSLGYKFDDIGNRQSASRNGRTDSYIANDLNQIRRIDYAPWLHVLGQTSDGAFLTVNDRIPTRTNGYFYAQLEATSIWNSISIQSRLTNGTVALGRVDGHLIHSTTPGAFEFDDDGNLLSDGRWLMTWDAENRVVRKESLPTLPQLAQHRLDYTLDSSGRKVLVKSFIRDSGVWRMKSSQRFLHNQFEILAEFDAASDAIVQSYVWGLDLVGSRHVAGGVGGLLMIESHLTDTVVANLPTFDGNGNVVALVDRTKGTLSANYEYDPFGFVLRASGSAASLNPFGYSTKYTEVETGDIRYEYRDYRPSTGRWISRDPVQERGGENLYAFVRNNGVNRVDPWGLSELSEAQYAAKAGNLIDSGIVDPDQLFRELINYYFQHDIETDWFWDCQDDMEELFDALGDVFATNFRNQPPGSPSETQDAKRFRKVRDWVEGWHWNFSAKPKMKKVFTTPSGKYDNRMDAVMHFYAGGAISANVGETLADLISWGVEVSDEVKDWFGSSGGGYDSVDLAWGQRGSELQTAFEVSECKCRKLAVKFQNGTFTPSRWSQWYKKPEKVLY